MHIISDRKSTTVAHPDKSVLGRNPPKIVEDENFRKLFEKVAGKGYAEG